MFLQPSPPRLTRRSRLEHLLLLLLRCVVFCLLALGFSRPFIKKALPPPPPTAARRTLVLVDTSASMRRANLWLDARKKAESVFRGASPADQLALYTFDRQIRPLVTFDQWNTTPISERSSFASAKLAETSPGWSSTALAHALVAAAEALSEKGADSAIQQRSSIILITDLQEGSHLEPLQGYEWPKGITVSIQTLKPNHTSNASLQLLADSPDAEPNPSTLNNQPSTTSIRLRVSNNPGSKLEQFKLGWAAPGTHSFAATPLDIYVPAGQSRIISLPFDPSTPNPQPTTNSSSIIPHPSSILLTGDEEDFDNTIYVIPPEPMRLAVLYLGSDSSKDPHQPLYFLERAFQETRRQIVQIQSRLPDAADIPSVIHQSPTVNPLIIVTDPLRDDLARALHDEIVGGKTLLFAPKADDSAATLAHVLALSDLRFQSPASNDKSPTTTRSYSMLGQIDFQHPLFAPFADPRYSDFTKIHFWKYRHLDASAIPGARIIAKFDNDHPALIEVPLGKGRVIILTSTWRPEDSQLALSSKFVPLLYSLLDFAGPSAPAPIEYHVGDPIPSLETPQKPATVTRSPDQFFPAPGIYSNRFAVNLDPSESRTQPLPADQLEHLGVPVAYQNPNAPRQPPNWVHLQNVDLENRQKLWRWCIVAALALLILETWLAGRTARRGLATADS